MRRPPAPDHPRHAWSRLSYVTHRLSLPGGDLRVVQPSAGAEVLATDGSDEALELVERNARENGVEVATARADWAAGDDLVARGPFDLVLAADVLYERASVAPLLSLLPRLGG